jgi:hypothetical protein
MDRRRLRNPPARPLVLIVDGHEDTRAVDGLAAGLRRVHDERVPAHVEGESATKGCRP